MKLAATLMTAVLFTVSLACTRQNDTSYKDGVQRALEQADLKGVSVAEDKDKNTITLTGKLHSEDAKQQVAQVAQNAAGSRVVANEINVEPVRLESQAKQINDPFLAL